MYKCTECGLEFEIKPEYCDCGNDEFTVFGNEILSEIVQPNPEAMEDAKPEMTDTMDNERESNNIPDKKESFSLPYSPLALAFFMVCMVLSLLILFAWNPVNTTEEIVEIEQKVLENKQIPSIDKLWKRVNVEDAKVIVERKTLPPKTTIVTLNKVNNSTKPIKKQNTLKTTKPASAPQVANKTQTSSIQKPQEDAQKIMEAKRKAEAEALAAAEKARKSAIAKQELANYKINLRNEIGRKIDFTRVIGDGNCVISFKLDSSGKLINRAFIEQSSNITLNNAVYNAVMATPSYNSPPSAYNNEVLKLNIRFMNGNFAITLE